MDEEHHPTRRARVRLLEPVRVVLLLLLLVLHALLRTLSPLN